MTSLLTLGIFRQLSLIIRCVIIVYLQVSVEVLVVEQQVELWWFLGSPNCPRSGVDRTVFYFYT